MKAIVDDFTKEFENRSRLAIMSALITGEQSDFTALKVLLQLTDGNLSSHLAVLEKQRFIKVKKSFVGKKPSTSYTVTEKGRRAFQQHVDALQLLIRPHSTP